MAMEAQLLQHGCTTQRAIGDGSCLIWSFVDAIAHGAAVAGERRPGAYTWEELQALDSEVRTGVTRDLHAASLVESDPPTRQVDVANRHEELKKSLRSRSKVYLGETELLVMASGVVLGWKGNVYMFSVSGADPVRYSYRQGSIDANAIFGGDLVTTTDALRSLRQDPRKNIAVLNINGGHWQPIVYTHHAEAEYRADNDLDPVDFSSVTDPGGTSRVWRLAWDNQYLSPEVREMLNPRPVHPVHPVPKKKRKDSRGNNNRRLSRVRQSRSATAASDPTQYLSSRLRNVRMSDAGSFDDSSDDGALEAAHRSATEVFPERLSFSGALQRQLRLWHSDRLAGGESVRDEANLFDGVKLLDTHAKLSTKDLALVVGARWVQNNEGSVHDETGSARWLDSLTINNAALAAVRQSLGVALTFDGGSKHSKRVAFSNELVFGLDKHGWAVFYFGVWIGPLTAFPKVTEVEVPRPGHLHRAAADHA